MIQEAFQDIFTTEFKGFTSRMWLDYCDEHSDLRTSTPLNYAGYVVENMKYLIRRFNTDNDNTHLNIK